MPTARGRAGADGSGRTLVLGDVHGAARALDQVFERARFDVALEVGDGIVAPLDQV